MSLTKVSYSMITGSPGNVLDYGANTTPGTTDMASAINAAIAAHDDVYIPEGTYRINSTILVPAGKKVHGAGAKTIIKPYLSSGQAAFTVGNPANNVLSYGCQVTDLNISPPQTYTNTIGLLIYSSVGGYFANIQIQPADTNMGITGMKFDGGASGFFNLFENFLCNHCHIGFWMTTTGASYPTNQTFIGCSSFGDVAYGDTTSIGFKFENVSTNSCGIDSIVINGNVESCGKGVEIINFNGAIFNALRFEANTVDVAASSLTQNCKFTNLSNWDTASNFPSPGGGYGSNTIVGCSGTYGEANQFYGSNTFWAYTAATTPVVVRLATSQTAPGFQIRASYGAPNTRFQVGGTYNNYSTDLNISALEDATASYFPNGHLNIVDSSGSVPQITMRSYTAPAGEYMSLSVWSTAGNLRVMNQSGIGQYQANGGAAWIVISDETKKNIIEPITDGLAKVSSLRSVIYSLKSDEKNTRRVGLIAQEVQKVLPEAVDEVDGTLGLAYTDVIPLLVAALKEANERITALENK